MPKIEGGLFHLRNSAWSGLIKPGFPGKTQNNSGNISVTLDYVIAFTYLVIVIDVIFVVIKYISTWPIGLLVFNLISVL